MEKSSDIQAAIHAGKQLAGLEIKEINGIPVVLVPNDMSFRALYEYMERPTRIEATVRTDTTSSFLDYFNAFATDNSAIFIDAENGKTVGIIDYHDPSAGTPGWRKHRVLFEPRVTDEAGLWLANNGRQMDQEEFALFLEQNAEEIVSPPAAEMLEIALTLKTKQKISFSSAKRLQNGQIQYQYIEELEGRAGQKGELTIPEQFEIGLRIFEGGDAYAMKARFRYRIGDGVKFWYDLIRPNRIKRDAIDSMAKHIRANAKCNLFVEGQP